MNDQQKLPRALGVSRDFESPSHKSVLIDFEREITDDELRALHDMLATPPTPFEGDRRDTQRLDYLQECQFKRRAEHEEKFGVRVVGGMSFTFPYSLMDVRKHIDAAIAQQSSKEGV